jgi:beta-glucanase (GH16 family)
MSNFFLKMRLYTLMHVTKKFVNVPRNDLQKHGYAVTFEDDFDDPVKFVGNGWEYMESWGDPAKHTCIKDKENPYIIWKPQQVAIDTANSVALCTTDKNDVAGEPRIKSGELTTFKSLNQRYGWFECRMKACPGGVSFWNSFILYNKATGWLPEIDIAEFTESDSKGFSITVHPQNASKKNPHGSFSLNIDLSKEFHIYALNWTEKKLEFYFDNLLIFETDEHVPQVPLYILVGNAIRRGQKTMTLPAQTMTIDYVRVYRPV